MEMTFVLNAPEQVLWARSLSGTSTAHTCDKGYQYVSLAYTQRLKDTGIGKEFRRLVWLRHGGEHQWPLQNRGNIP